MTGIKKIRIDPNQACLTRKMQEGLDSDDPSLMLIDIENPGMFDGLMAIVVTPAAIALLPIETTELGSYALVNEWLFRVSSEPSGKKYSFLSEVGDDAIKVVAGFNHPAWGKVYVFSNGAFVRDQVLHPLLEMEDEEIVTPAVTRKVTKVVPKFETQCDPVWTA